MDLHIPYPAECTIPPSQTTTRWDGQDPKSLIEPTCRPVVVSGPLCDLSPWSNIGAEVFKEVLQ